MVIAPGGAIYVGLLKGEAVATFALTPQGEGKVELNKMAVDEEHRGKGFGHQMMEYILRVCQREVHRWSSLSHITKPVIHLYETYGFEPVPVPAPRVRPSRYPHADDVVTGDRPPLPGRPCALGVGKPFNTSCPAALAGQGRPKTSHVLCTVVSADGRAGSMLNGKLVLHVLSKNSHATRLASMSMLPHAPGQSWPPPITL